MRTSRGEGERDSSRVRDFGNRKTDEVRRERTIGKRSNKRRREPPLKDREEERKTVYQKGKPFEKEEERRGN